MIIGGIDEAGRGPIIGPMVMAITCIDEKDIPKLEALGVKDSKLLTPAMREGMFDKIKAICAHSIKIIPPSLIDSAVEGENTNLNWLEADTAVLMLNDLKPKKAFIDCPSTNEKAYSNYLSSKLDYKPELIVEHKADLHYLIVGAASILAKVTRDREIEKLKLKHHINFGSGYPSDPLTADFVRNNYEKYDFFRKSWSTWKKAAGIKKQKKLGEF